MSTVNYFEAPQTLVSTNNRETNPRESEFDLQPVMKGARLSYGAAVLLVATLVAGAFGFALGNIFWVLTVAAVVQTCGIFLLRKISSNSQVLPSLTTALVLLIAGSLCMVTSQVLLHNFRVEAAANLLFASLVSWGFGGVALLIGLQRIGSDVNQPAVGKNATRALVMLTLTYAAFGTYVFYIADLIEPAIAMQAMKFTSAVLATMAVIGLVFFIRSVSILTRLAEIQLAERANQTNFSELGEAETAARGHEMDFLKM